MTTLGEAILIIPAKLLKDGATSEDIAEAISAAVKDGEALNQDNGADSDETAPPVADGNSAEEGQPVVLVADGGHRMETGVDDEGEDEEAHGDSVQPAVQVRSKKRGASSKECNSHEARFLTKYATTTSCRRKVWDRFFRNNLKCEPESPV